MSYCNEAKTIAFIGHIFLAISLSFGKNTNCCVMNKQSNNGKMARQMQQKFWHQLPSAVNTYKAHSISYL